MFNATTPCGKSVESEEKAKRDSVMERNLGSPLPSVPPSEQWKKLFQDTEKFFRDVTITGGGSR